ncbi:MAG: hypothetical protein J0M36_06415 [Caulobacterales bacterium]|nr:hypothetical protein [Caulobacterales bacterium]
MRLITVLCTAVLLSAPAVSAQTPGNPTPPRVPQVNNGLRLGGSAGDYQRRLATNALEREQNQEPTPQELLIERIAPLVAEGRCNEARQLARQEGDRAVSRRIGEVCIEGRATPIPAAPSR